MYIHICWFHSPVRAVEPECNRLQTGSTVPSRKYSGSGTMEPTKCFRSDSAIVTPDTPNTKHVSIPSQEIYAFSRRSPLLRDCDGAEQLKHLKI